METFRKKGDTLFLIQRDRKKERGNIRRGSWKQRRGQKPARYGKKPAINSNTRKPIPELSGLDSPVGGGISEGASQEKRIHLNCLKNDRQRGNAAEKGQIGLSRGPPQQGGRQRWQGVSSI